MDKEKIYAMCMVLTAVLVLFAVCGMIHNIYNQKSEVVKFVDPDFIISHFYEYNVKNASTELTVKCFKTNGILEEGYRNTVKAHLSFEENREIDIYKSVRGESILEISIISYLPMKKVRIKSDYEDSLAKEIANFSNGKEIRCKILLEPIKFVVSEYLAWNGTRDSNQCNAEWRFIQNITFYEENDEYSDFFGEYEKDEWIEVIEDIWYYLEKTQLKYCHWDSFDGGREILD